MSVGRPRAVLVAIALGLLVLTSCGGLSEQKAVRPVPRDVSAWAKRTVDVLESGLDGARPVPSIYLPDGRDSVYDVSAAAIALISSGHQLTSSQTASFLRVVSEAWIPQKRAWRSAAVPSGATADMVYNALRVLRESAPGLDVHVARRVSQLLAYARATVDASANPAGRAAPGRIIAQIRSELDNRNFITSAVIARLHRLSLQSHSAVDGDAAEVLSRVAQLLSRGQITPHPVALAVVTQALRGWGLAPRLPRQAKEFLDEILRFGAMRSVVIKDGHTYAQVVTALQELDAPLGKTRIPAWRDVADPLTNIDLRLAFDLPVPALVVERASRALKGNPEPRAVGLLARASLQQRAACGPQLTHLLMKSIQEIQGVRNNLNELSSLRAAQAWWVAASASRCATIPGASRSQAKLSTLVASRLRTLVSGDRPSDVEQVVSLAALIDIECVRPVTDVHVSGAELSRRAMAVTNPFGGAGYREGQIDPFVTAGVSRVLSFANHGCNRRTNQ